MDTWIVRVWTCVCVCVCADVSAVGVCPCVRVTACLCAGVSVQMTSVEQAWHGVSTDHRESERIVPAMLSLPE